MCQQLASYVLAVVHYNHKHHAVTAVVLSGCVSLHIIWYIAMFSGAHCKQLETQMEHSKRMLARIPIKNRSLRWAKQESKILSLRTLRNKITISTKFDLEEELHNCKLQQSQLSLAQ